MPSNTAAWLTTEKAYPFEIKAGPNHNAGPNEVVIKNSAIAINPLDWMVQSTDMAGMLGAYPTIVGCDIAGIIDSVGSSVTTFKAGDRVLGDCDSIATKNAAHGAFQNYTTLDAGRVAKIPDSMSFEEACVLPTSLNTATLLLFDSSMLGLKKPSLNTPAGSTGEAVLVWGGSGSVGSGCIQVARAAGYEVITTASKRNEQYCKELGASAVVDYRNADTVVDEVIAALKGKQLVGAVDTTAREETVAKCGEILKKAGRIKKVATVLPTQTQPEGVEVAMINSLFTPHVAGFWHDYLPKALESGEIKAKPDPVVVGSGIESIQAGLDKNKSGMSAGKVVVKL